MSSWRNEEPLAMSPPTVMTTELQTQRRQFLALALATGCAGFWPRGTGAQPPTVRVGDVVPRDVREIYDRGLQYLVSSQDTSGDWKGGQSGAGTTGMAVMVFLASGEDPNFGIYSTPIRRALTAMIRHQDARTGFFGQSMYQHGFAMLAIAEAYGAVDERTLWSGNERKQRTLGACLEVAVRAAVDSQKKNSVGGWRYSPESTDADTSVSGAVLVGLLAARNAGIEVPDESIDKAVRYFVSMTSDGGQVAYSGGLGGFDESLARISIATLCYCIARRKDLKQFKATLAYLAQRLEVGTSEHYLEYTRYYQAQALFQGDLAAWEKWNKQLVRQLKTTQNSDGSFPCQFGAAVGTALSLLALALNFRFLPIYER